MPKHSASSRAGEAVAPPVRRVSRRALVTGVITLAVASFTGNMASAFSHDVASQGPVATLQAYLRAAYARDSAAAYALISQADRALKTADDHARETGAFGPVATDLARALAAMIRFENVRVDSDGHRMKVSFSADLPNAGAQEIRELALDFDERALSRLSPLELQARAKKLRQMTVEGRMPFLRSDHEEWQLVAENGAWRVHLNWAGAVEVVLEAATKDDLPWEFVPSQPRLLVAPGETVETSYRVRNRGDRETSGKARHIVGPSAAAKHLNVIACFCFLERTLAPGETAELPLVVRLDYETPDDIGKLTLRYEFFPTASFPKEATQ